MVGEIASASAAAVRAPATRARPGRAKGREHPRGDRRDHPAADLLRRRPGGAQQPAGGEGYPGCL